MGYELTRELLLLGFGMFAICAWIAARRLSYTAAVFVAAIRAAIPVIYFAWYFDGSWTFIDDFMYFHQGQFLLDNGYTPLSALTPEGIDTLKGLAGGSHVLYIWWNFLMMWLFGVNYYAPVCGNVVITFVSGHFFVELLAEAGFQERYRRVLHVFYLLHWETIAWSSFINLKDATVQLLTILLFLSAIRCVERRSWRAGVACLVVAQAFAWIRFYIPVIAACAGLAWIFLEWRDWRKHLILGGAFLAGLTLVPKLLGRVHSVNPAVALWGAGHYLLTPQPWAVLPSYSFLEIPSVCHWLMFLPACFGGIYLWNESRVARLLLIYILAIVAFYALVVDLQGVRHRSQISFIFAWIQFHFLWRWVNAPATQEAFPSQAVVAQSRPAPSFGVP